SRIEGVGGTQVFGAKYAMRIWLDPSKLAAFDMTPSDVVASVSSQNAQISAGSFGSLPSLDGQAFTATITAQSLLETPEDFRNIILRSEGDGGLVLLEDVARVEIGAENYMAIAQFNGNPASGMAVQLAPGANALDTSELVREKIEEYAEFFPEGMTYVIPYDTTPFVEISIHEVQKT
ncbi:efflux RND transporter permease subunit, partial [Falsihalocynthiibacter sp. BN13B15]|uniref:efflux RND transporter permease subunit n=1 Tax=Falsihalocynthiibacter sp. BN13B15 TaxID=3240871 RepID=UPI0035100D3C